MLVACSLATRFHGRDCLGGVCVITVAFFFGAREDQERRSVQRTRSM